MITAARQRFVALLAGKGLRGQLIRAGLGSAGIQAANRVLALGLGIVLARTLGAEGYGVYAFAFAMMSLLMVVAEAGVPTLLMREVAASQARAEWGLLHGILRWAGQFVALAAGVVALVGFLVLWAVGHRLSPSMLHTTALMLLVLPLAAGIKTIAHALNGFQRVVLGQVVDMLVRPLLVLLLVSTAFVLCPELRQPAFAMAAQLVGAAVVLVAGMLILRRLVPREVVTSPPVCRGRQWLRSAVPFTLVGGAGVVNNNTDIIMLGWLNGPEEAGVYRAAVQGATLAAFGLQVINAVVAPQFSRLYAQGDRARLQRLVTRSAQMVLLVALPIALAFILAGGAIVTWVFGNEFASAHAPLAILAAGQLINAGFGSVGFLLNMTGHEGVTARTLWQTALLNIVLNAVLIPLYGMNGAAVATAISLATWNALLYRQVRQRLRISSIALRIPSK